MGARLRFRHADGPGAAAVDGAVRVRGHVWAALGISVPFASKNAYGKRGVSGSNGSVSFSGGAAV